MWTHMIAQDSVIGIPGLSLQKSKNIIIAEKTYYILTIYLLESQQKSGHRVNTMPLCLI